MNWKYLLSLSPEDLTDDEKDELYNTVTWFNCNGEELNVKKCVALIKVSQEILKYKGEQVETLLHELDELATKQGEEDARKLESDTEIVSSKSRKSSSIEFENLEQKYTELKNKFKKQAKLISKTTVEFDKLKNKVSGLERENNLLHQELQSKGQDGSESDVSETIREQHKELVEVVQNKNKHISELLRDIESVEKENCILREKLTIVRDDLATATEELALLTEKINGAEAKLAESLEQQQSLTGENEVLQEQLQNLQEEKHIMEKQLEDFAKEINYRIDEWKKIITQKDLEIEELRTRNLQSSIHSSLSSLPHDETEKLHINVMQKLLEDREIQIQDLQIQLKEATTEMQEITELIENLKTERSNQLQKLEDTSSMNVTLKKQLKASHERSQTLQEDLKHAEKLASGKDADLKQLVQSLKEEGEIDLSSSVDHIYALKSEKRHLEKRIAVLVNSSNKLQDNFDEIKRENEILRNKLGLEEDDNIDSISVPHRRSRKSKEISELNKKLAKYEEENLNLRSRNQKLNRHIAKLSDQIVDLGHDPKESSLSRHDGTKTDYLLTKEETTAMIEENEALRKGMHEILNSINAKKETSVREIKSETLEKLLRALDVRHISGWYHPAMRLQAELHNLEGINAELREQLRFVRMENEKFRNEIKSSDISEGEVVNNQPIMSENQIEEGGDFQENVNSFENIISSLNDNIDVTLDKMLKILEIITSETFTCDKYQKAGILLKNMVNHLSEKYIEYKSKYEEDMILEKEKYSENEKDLEIFKSQVKVLTDNQSEDSMVKKLVEFSAADILNKRKITFLEQQTNKLTKDKECLEQSFENNKEDLLKELKELIKTNDILKSKLEILDIKLKMSVDSDLFNETKKNLLNLTEKHRQLSQNFEKTSEEKQLELNILKETNKYLETNKNELKSRLTDVLTKLYSFENINQHIDDGIEKLSKKIAESEVKEISERQRADHTNNLYELVKEQLHKSEERLQDFSKYNDTILRKNLLLQEQLKDVEIKLCEYVDKEEFNQVKLENCKLLEEVNNLKVQLKTEMLLREDIKIKESKQINWSAKKEQELLSLKHQIVDLIAVSDEKMLIAQLHSDIKYYKMLDVDYTEKNKKLSEEVDYYKKKYEECLANLENERIKLSDKENQIKKRMSIVENILLQQKMQYFGCVPMVSEDKYINKLRKIAIDKHETFLALMKIQKLENDTETIREQCNIELQNLMEQHRILQGDKEEYNKMLKWLQEKKTLQLNELRYKRQAEFKDVQMQQLTERIKSQDQELANIEEELVITHKNLVHSLDFNIEPEKLQNVEFTQSHIPPMKITKSEEIQTVEELPDVNISDESKITNLKSELSQVRSELASKETMIDQLKGKITEQEMNLSLFKKQLGDKQSQIQFYERHIVELQSKDNPSVEKLDVADSEENNAEKDNANNNEEILSLKALVAQLQDTIQAKEKAILDYESLLKDDRDKHSLAAASLQEEIKTLQQNIAQEKQRNKKLEDHVTQVSRDDYSEQVDDLEKHTAELHTSVTSLEAQLKSSKQEAVRWRKLANDRLEAMNDLHKNLEDRHRNELSVYKEDSEKWREEVNSLKNLIAKHRADASNITGDIQKIIKEKDNRIHELTVLLRQAKTNVIRAERTSELELNPKLADLEYTREVLQKENESLKKRHEQLIQRERNAREEIRELRAQLIKKPITSARSDKSEKSIKDHLQRKITSLEAEIIELKDNLANQIAINETHRVKSAEDFERWKKQKQCQQTTEKLKNKLKEKDLELEKLTQTSTGYRMLIERLEREKHNLENRIRNLKASGNVKPNEDVVENLRIDNMKLLAENQSLMAKLEMNQHHAGGLGAAMLQEKLEAQERKIAILEVTSKGNVEIRSEMERMQAQISSLQKANLSLEAENLETKMDLEKSKKELPYLQEQIQHLENYVEVLKSENTKFDNTSDNLQDKNVEVKKVSELERTVFILKRVVEKLQVENKRLQSGKRVLPDRVGSTDKLRRDYLRLKEQYQENIRKVSQLENEVAAYKEQIKKIVIRPVSDNAKVLSDELAEVRNQLQQKNLLLDKVKVLLQRAAIKEKALLDEIAELKQAKSSAN